jgi:uncharacterized membrane protein YidH (DUF202 family)
MLSTLRRSLLAIFCTSLGFLLAGVGFQKMTEYDDFMQAAQTYRIIGLSLNLVYISAFLLLLAVLGGSLPVASSILQSALTRKRYGTLFLLTVPFLAFTIFVGTTFLLEAILKPGNHLSAVWSLLLERGFFLGILLAAVVASTAALCLAALRSVISTELLRFALLLSIPATFFMGFMLTVLLIWGLSLRSNVPQLFNGNGGIFASSTAGSWLGMVIILGIMMMIASISLISGLSAHSALRTTIA